MRTLWALALLAAVAESLTIQDAAITSGNGEDEDNPADEGKRVTCGPLREFHVEFSDRSARSQNRAVESLRN